MKMDSIIFIMIDKKLVITQTHGNYSSVSLDLVSFVE